MSLLPSATESQQGEWRAVGEGFRRFEIGKPVIFEDQTWGGMKVRFPLTLTPSEQERQLQELGDPEPGTQQSWISSYRPGLKLGFFKEGKYQTTMLVDFLCAALGAENGKKFRKWIEKGGHGPRPADKNDREAELALLGEWLAWFEGLEVYGTITHSTGKDGRVWANFAGPMPIGSLPNQPEAEYQALARGKLRALISEAGPQEGELAKQAPMPETKPEPVPAKRSFKEVFPDEEDDAF